jgi:hypothetical protein
MAVGGRLEVPSYLRGQTAQILQSPKLARSAGTTAYRGVPEEVDTTLYGSGTWVRQNARVTDQSGAGNQDRCVNSPDVLRDREEPSR